MGLLVLFQGLQRLPTESDVSILDGCDLYYPEGRSFHTQFAQGLCHAGMLGFIQRLSFTYGDDLGISVLHSVHVHSFSVSQPESVSVAYDYTVLVCTLVLLKDRPRFCVSSTWPSAAAP